MSTASVAAPKAAKPKDPAAPKAAAAPQSLSKHASMVTLTMGSQSPRDSFKNVAKPGSMVGLTAGYRVTRWLASGVEFNYFHGAGIHNGAVFTIPQDPGTGKPVTVTLVESWSLTELGVYAKAFVYERGRLSPYLRVGAGGYTIRYSQDVSAASAGTTLGGVEQASKPGVNVGVGLRYRVLGGTSIGLEVLYHEVFTRDARVNLLTTGATLGFGPAGN